MKKISLIVFTLLFISRPYVVHAHMPGQAAFLKINSKYADYYTVLKSSIPEFDLPQDDAPEVYLINAPISFEIDVERLGVTGQTIQQTEFTWEWGDGQTQIMTAKTRMNHTYKKMGSYEVSIYTQDGTTPTPQLLESVMLHIVPNKTYILNRAIILVNGQSLKDPVNNTLPLTFHQPLQFDGTTSHEASSHIVSYFWDLGDGKTSTEPKVVHSYTKDTKDIYPFLRIKTADGFISDSFVSIINVENPPEYAKTSITPIPSPTPGKSGSTNGKTLFPLLIAAVCIVGFGVYKALTTRKK